MAEIKSHILAIIPARGGSKGVPRKNIRLLDGRPLIDYSIRAALDCGGIDKVIVSTEDEEIASVARDCGALVPFLRPPNLAGDSANVQAAIDHVLAMLRLEGYHPNAYLVLYPTHPFRPQSMMQILVQKLAEGKRMVKTVRAIAYSKNYCAINDQGSPELLTFDNVPMGTPLFRNYGLASGRRLVGGQGCYYHVVNDPISLIDLDTFEDFTLAEAVLQDRAFDFRS